MILIYKFDNRTIEGCQPILFLAFRKKEMSLNWGWLDCTGERKPPITLVQIRFFTTGAQSAQRNYFFIWRGGARQIKSLPPFQGTSFPVAEPSTGLMIQFPNGWG